MYSEFPTRKDVQTTLRSLLSTYEFIFISKYFSKYSLFFIKKIQYLFLFLSLLITNFGFFHNNYLSFFNYFLIIFQ